MKKLSVPYYAQPTNNSCQSTCIKMMSEYIDGLLGRPLRDRNIINDIRRIMETDPDRPDKKNNALGWENMRWWLNREYLREVNFEFKTTTNDRIAFQCVVDRIESKFPVMVSTNHSRTTGHVILVVGYNVKATDPFSPQFTKFICHDPYGEFSPELVGHRYSESRYEGGESIATGGEEAAGKNVQYSIQGIKRIRNDVAAPNTFFLLLPDTGQSGG